MCLAQHCSTVKGWYPQASSLPISELSLEIIPRSALARDRNFTSKDFTVNDFLLLAWSLVYFYFPTWMDFIALLLQGFVIENCVIKSSIFGLVIRTMCVLKDLVFS